MVCNICNGKTFIEIKVKEQMLGLNEWFLYYKCDYCGHATLQDIPKEMDKYYNKDSYYSFSNKKSFFKSSSLKAFQKLGIKHDSQILDYGCGAGQFVNELNENGYCNVSGYDKYMPEEIRNKNKEGRLYNNISKLPYLKYEAITLNHVLEHLEKPIDVLKNLTMALNNGGKIMIRIPVIDSFAFKKYGEHWVQFDAPRHINLFTRKSIKLAVNKVEGLKITDLYDDSYHFQFTGSELYKKGISLKEGNKSQLKRLLSFNTYLYHFMAKRLNKLQQGDQIVLILEKV